MVDHTERLTEERSYRPRALDASVRRYIVGLAAFGVATGFFAGASSTPIVGTLLPLLFGMLGGTGGVYLAAADLQSNTTSWRFAWLGKALAAFGLTCLVGTAIGISGRLYFAHAQLGADLTKLRYANVADAIEIAVLRSKLRMLGATSEEQETVLMMAADELSYARSRAAAQKIRDLVSRTSAAVRVLEEAKRKIPPTDEDVTSDLDKTISNLENFVYIASGWTTTGVPYELWENQIADLYYGLGDFTQPVHRDNIIWLRSTGIDRAPIDELYRRVQPDFALTRHLAWKLSDKDPLNSFLAILGKRGIAAEKEDEIMPSEALPDDTKKAGSAPQTKGKE